MVHRARSASLILAALTIASAFSGATLPGSRAAGIDHVVIREVYYDTYVKNEPDEFVRLYNPTDQDVSLAGWMLDDGEGNVTFPSGAVLKAGAKAYVTGRATSFRLDMPKSDPSWEFLADTDPNVPQMTRKGTFSLSNSGDEVLLKDSSGAIVDAVVFGASSYSGEGWTGAPIPKVSEGVILERDVDEATREPVEDTDSKADWDDNRMYVVGQSHWPLDHFEFDGDVRTYASPDSLYAEVMRAFNETTSTMDLELYQITNVHVGNVLLDRVKAGVKLRMLMEGGPAGMAKQDRYQENWILKRLVDAGAEVRFIITNDSLEIHDRYDFQHAKHGILDGRKVFAQSGNFKYSGTPVDSSYGNREWGILIDHEPLAGYMQQIFDDDFDSAYRDILPFGEGGDWRYHPPPEDFSPNATVPRGTYEAPYPTREITGHFRVTPVNTPDTDLLEQGSLLEALRGAKKEILIEQMYAHKHWGPTGNGTPETTPNVFLEAALDAARNNGAALYILLGDEYIDEEDTRNNYETVDYVRSHQEKGLKTYARIVDHRIANLTKIHNKGVVIDNEMALVSSINWGRNSAQENREVAFLVENPDVAQFYSDVFWYDWSPKDRVPPTDLVVTDIELVFPKDAPATPAPPKVLAEPVPGVPAPGDPLPKDLPADAKVRVTVANHGNHKSSKIFDVQLRGTPYWLGPGEEIGVIEVNMTLEPGENVTIEFPWRVVGKLGTWKLRAVADPDNRVLEADDLNNGREEDVTLVAPFPGINVPGYLGKPDVPPPFPPPPTLPPTPVPVPSPPAVPPLPGRP